MPRCSSASRWPRAALSQTAPGSGFFFWGAATPRTWAASWTGVSGRQVQNRPVGPQPSLSPSLGKSAPPRMTRYQWGSFTVRGRQIARGFRKKGVDARAWNWPCKEWCKSLCPMRAMVKAPLKPKYSGNPKAVCKECGPWLI